MGSLLSFVAASANQPIKPGSKSLSLHKKLFAACWVLSGTECSMAATLSTNVQPGSAVNLLISPAGVLQFCIHQPIECA